jgi:iron complex outermembrane receptor protein
MSPSEAHKKYRPHRRCHEDCFETSDCIFSASSAHFLSDRCKSGGKEDVIVIKTRRLVARVTTFIALSLPLIGGALRAQESRDLSSLSVDDLMNVEVTSVSRKGQKLSDTAAAVFVISQDDIRRSGATTIPEILRIMPGLDVARVNGNVWAISARGSNGQYANKLLVMIDGRSVYTPLFGGVYWDALDTLLEDVERIEVIRGPGGTLWGANAVNGIINIITKHAIETQGALVSAGGGTAAEGLSTAGRYGGSIGHNGYYRVYGKSFDRPASVGGTDPTHDAWSIGQAGFRADWNSRGGSNFTVQGDIYHGTESSLGPFDPLNASANRASLIHVTGQDIQFRWTAIQSSRSDTTLQASYDHTARPQQNFVSDGHTLNLDFQQHLKAGRRNDIVWGAGFNSVHDRVGGPAVALLRETNNVGIASAFVQDEIQVAPRFQVIIGTKILYEPLEHPQLQPTLRFLFKASERQTIWAAATSAIRWASEIEENVRFNLGAFPDGTEKGGLIVLTGNPDVTPERVDSYEAGYRWQPAPNLAFDATAFHNSMHKLIVTAATQPFTDASGRTIIPVGFANSGTAKANGAEFLLTDSVATHWNVALGYAFFQSSSKNPDLSSPRHQLQLRSFIQLPRQFELDASAYYTGRLGHDVPAFLRLDTQLSWRPARRWEVSVSGQNLLQSRHSEFVGVNGESALATPVQRTVNGKITWRF